MRGNSPGLTSTPAWRLTTTPATLLVLRPQLKKEQMSLTSPTNKTMSLGLRTTALQKLSYIMLIKFSLSEAQ